MYTLIPAKKIKKKQGKGGSPGHDTPSFLDPNMWIVIMHVNPNISTELHYKSTVWLVGVLFTLKRMHKQYVYVFLDELQLKWDSDYQILQWDIRPLLWKNTLPIRSSKEKNRNQTLCISDMYTCISFRAHIGVNQFKEMQHCESYRIYITACP